MFKNEKLPFNLQFFADDNKDDDAKNDPGDVGGDDSKDESGGNGGEKTFTQAQVTAMMAREKKEGRRGLLKALGFKSETEAKNAVALYEALVNSQKSDDQKKIDEANKALDDKTDAEKRAEAAENKLACIMAGVKKDAVEDALAIAQLKVTDDKGIDKVLVEMSKETKYASFFADENGNDDTGTGSGVSHNNDKKQKKKGSYGAELAEASNKKKSEKKSIYF